VAQKKYDGEQLRRSFSDYDQDVEVVCCWHSWYEKKVPRCAFDRFPRRTTPDGHEATPDFVVDFENGYVLVGEVCRLPNQEDGFQKSVAQALGYTRLGATTDVVVLVPFGHAPQSELRIRQQGLLEDDAPVVLLAHARNVVDANECWEFVRTAGGRSARFRDDFLGDDLSLGIRLCDQLGPLRVGIRYCMANKQTYPFINDQPPAIYAAVFLCMKVVPLALSEEDYLVHRLEDKDVAVLVTPEQLKSLCAERLAVKMPLDWIRSALELLNDAGLAKKQGGGYLISLVKLHVTKSGDRELMRQITHRLDPTPAPSSPPAAQTTLEVD